VGGREGGSSCSSENSFFSALDDDDKMASSYRDGDGGAHVGGSEAVRFSDTTGYEALPVMSGIEEKGFPSSSLASSVSTPLVSFPGNPSVTAFPVARHRSQGPVSLHFHCFVLLLLVYISIPLLLCGLADFLHVPELQCTWP
jgi:hypothetical protein